MPSADPKLNELYTEIGKIAEEDPNNTNRLMDLMDLIYDRRVELGEIDEDEEFGI